MNMLDDIRNGLVDAYKGGIAKNNHQQIMNASAFTLDTALVPEYMRAVQFGNEWVRRCVDVIMTPHTSGLVQKIGHLRQVFGTKQTGRTGIDSTQGSQEPFALNTITADIGFTFDQLAEFYYDQGYLNLVQSTVSDSRTSSVAVVGFNGQVYTPDILASASDNGRLTAPGWLQELIDRHPDRVIGITLADGDTGGYVAGRNDYTIDAIKIGSAAGADYATLEECVMEHLTGKVSPLFRANMVASVGNDIASYLSMSLFQPLSGDLNRTPENQLALQSLIASQKLGGRPILFPEDAPSRMILFHAVRGIAPTQELAYELAQAIPGGNNLVHYLHSQVIKQVDVVNLNSQYTDYEWTKRAWLFREAEGLLAFHPDAIQFHNGTDWVSAADVWKLT